MIHGFISRSWLGLVSATALAAALVAYPSQAMAQDGADQASADSDSTNEIGIVVTAQKREQALKDVPIAISAFSGSEVIENGWSSPVDVVALAPNVSGYSIFGNAFPLFFIRGIGTSDPGHGAMSPVGVYSNEVYHSSLAGQGFALFDLERVEVLRGPQGTLWGKNTTGGAMHFISKMPGSDFEGDASAKFELYNDDTPGYELQGGLSVPLVKDKLAARIALRAYTRGDWITNLARVGNGPSTQEGLDGLDEIAGRVTLHWTPSEAFSATLYGTIGRRNGDHVPLHFEPINNPNSFIRHGGFPADPSYDVVNQDHPSPERVEYENITLNAQIEGDWGSLTSITGYIHSFYSQDADVDATPRDALFGPFQADSKQFSQEVRFASTIGDSLNYIFGAYYFKESMNGFNWFLTGADLGPGSNFTGCCENSGFGNIEQRDRSSYALFASMDYKLTDKLTLNGGIRYTRDKENWAFQQLFWLFSSSRFLEGVPDANTAFTLFNSGPLDRSWSKLTGDMSLTYAVTDDVNVYGKWARGFLSGNHVLPFTGTNFNVVDPETIDSYEIGLKGSFAGGLIQLYTAAFYYDYKNVQVNRGTTVPGQAGFISIRENAAAATVKGFEIDAKFRPVEGMVISAGVGYTDAKFKEFIDRGVDRSGFRFPNVPKFNGNVQFSYDMPLKNDGSIEFATDWNYADGSFVDTNFDPIGRSESRTIGNAYLRYHAPGRVWTASLFARNVANKIYVVNRRSFASALEGNLVIYGQPRVIGAQLDMRF